MPRTSVGAETQHNLNSFVKLCVAHNKRSPCVAFVADNRQLTVVACEVRLRRQRSFSMANCDGNIVHEFAVCLSAVLSERNAPNASIHNGALSPYVVLRGRGVNSSPALFDTAFSPLTLSEAKTAARELPRAHSEDTITVARNLFSNDETTENKSLDSSGSVANTALNEAICGEGILRLDRAAVKFVAARTQSGRRAVHLQLLYDLVLALATVPSAAYITARLNAGSAPPAKDSLGLDDPDRLARFAAAALRALLVVGAAYDEHHAFTATQLPVRVARAIAALPALRTDDTGLRAALLQHAASAMVQPLAAHTRAVEDEAPDAREALDIQRIVDAHWAAGGGGPSDLSLPFDPRTDSRNLLRGSAVEARAYTTREALRDLLLNALRDYRDVGRSFAARSWPEFVATLASTAASMRSALSSAPSAAPMLARLILHELNLFAAHDVLGAGADAAAAETAAAASTVAESQTARREQPVHLSASARAGVSRAAVRDAARVERLSRRLAGSDKPDASPSPGPPALSAAAPFSSTDRSAPIPAVNSAALSWRPPPAITLRGQWTAPPVLPLHKQPQAGRGASCDVSQGDNAAPSTLADILRKQPAHKASLVMRMINPDRGSAARPSAHDGPAALRISPSTINSNAGERIARPFKSSVATQEAELGREGLRVPRRVATGPVAVDFPPLVVIGQQAHAAASGGSAQLALANPAPVTDDSSASATLPVDVIRSTETTRPHKVECTPSSNTTLADAPERTTSNCALHRRVSIAATDDVTSAQNQPCSSLACGSRGATYPSTQLPLHTVASTGPISMSSDAARPSAQSTTITCPTAKVMRRLTPASVLPVQAREAFDVPIAPPATTEAAVLQLCDTARLRGSVRVFLVLLHAIDSAALNRSIAARLGPDLAALASSAEVRRRLEASGHRTLLVLIRQARAQAAVLAYIDCAHILAARGVVSAAELADIITVADGAPYPPSLPMSPAAIVSAAVAAGSASCVLSWLASYVAVHSDCRVSPGTEHAVRRPPAWIIALRDAVEAMPPATLTLPVLAASERLMVAISVRFGPSVSDRDNVNVNNYATTGSREMTIDSDYGLFGHASLLDLSPTLRRTFDVAQAAKARINSVIPIVARSPPSAENLALFARESVRLLGNNEVDIQLPSSLGQPRRDTVVSTVVAPTSPPRVPHATLDLTCTVVSPQASHIAASASGSKSIVDYAPLTPSSSAVRSSISTLLSPVKKIAPTLISAHTTTSPRGQPLLSARQYSYDCATRVGHPARMNSADAANASSMSDAGSRVRTQAGQGQRCSDSAETLLSLEAAVLTETSFIAALNDAFYRRHPLLQRLVDVVSSTAVARARAAIAANIQDGSHMRCNIVDWAATAAAASVTAATDVPTTIGHSATAAERLPAEAAASLAAAEVRARLRQY